MQWYYWLLIVVVLALVWVLVLTLPSIVRYLRIRRM
jgi:hypothetical protein